MYVHGFQIVFTHNSVCRTRFRVHRQLCRLLGARNALCEKSMRGSHQQPVKHVTRVGRERYTALLSGSWLVYSPFFHIMISPSLNEFDPDGSTATCIHHASQETIPSG